MRNNREFSVKMACSSYRGTRCIEMNKAEEYRHHHSYLAVRAPQSSRENRLWCKGQSLQIDNRNGWRLKYSGLPR